MIFIILPVTVYTLFIMRMKPNNKQNTSRISNCTAKKVPAGLVWEPSTLRGPCHWLSMIPSVHWTVRGPRPRDGQFLLLRVFWSNRNPTSASAGSAVRPWAWIHRVSDLQLLSRLYRPFKVPPATFSQLLPTPVLGHSQQSLSPWCSFTCNTLHLSALPTCPTLSANLYTPLSFRSWLKHCFLKGTFLDYALKLNQGFSYILKASLTFLQST